jgi:hypothetical protein
MRCPIDGLPLRGRAKPRETDQPRLQSFRRELSVSGEIPLSARASIRRIIEYMRFRHPRSPGREATATRRHASPAGRSRPPQRNRPATALERGAARGPAVRRSCRQILRRTGESPGGLLARGARTAQSAGHQTMSRTRGGQISLDAPVAGIGERVEPEGDQSRGDETEQYGPVRGVCDLRKRSVESDGLLGVEID